MKRVRLVFVAALLAFSLLGGTVASADTLSWSLETLNLDFSSFIWE